MKLPLVPARLVLTSLGIAILSAANFAAAQVSQNHQPAATHLDQFALNALVQAGQNPDAFTQAFDAGSDQFSVGFNILDGIGVNVGNGETFTRIPRADLNGPGAWAQHTPPRITGPNAQSCEACHGIPFADGSGDIASNVIRDTFRTGNISQMIQRNTPHTFAPGAIQRLAEEMTQELHAKRDSGINQACQTQLPVLVPLSAKGVGFGSITINPQAGQPCQHTVDNSQLRGVDTDLVVKPFEWKGIKPDLRTFSRNAFNNEMGLQAVELVGSGVDGDFDTVTDEITAGDVTAMAIYLAAQPRPVSKLELDTLGLLETPLTAQEKTSINTGKRLMGQTGCTSCHVPMMFIDTPIYSEPSQSPDYRDVLTPSGVNPLTLGIDPALAITFDLTADQPDNQIFNPVSGQLIMHLGALERTASGRAVIRPFGDLKRHDMGSGLAESIDETGSGASTFMTENLWGVGSTAPYLHDGRATTLTEAILAHGGEALASRTAFVALSAGQQQDMIAFLDSMILFVNE
ncbi:MAG TPA: di-heme oxidoredictase family protein [Planctomycetota bacterium]|nr:di-heme oxidoredictase family protein [Planctomycetota bacterium]